MGLRGGGGGISGPDLYHLHDTIQELSSVRMGCCHVVSFSADLGMIWLTVYYSILWVAVFGIFGKMYIHEDPEGDSGVRRMKNAVWVDLINMLLWLVSALVGAFLFFKNKGHRSLHTGRAAV